MAENVTASFVLTRDILDRLDAVSKSLEAKEPFRSTGMKPSRSMVLRFVLERGLDVVERGDAPNPGGEDSP